MRPFILLLLSVLTAPVLSADPINMSAWTSLLPSNTSLSALTIPGTHNSLAFHVPGKKKLTPFSTCQHHPLTTQLTLGIRFLDLRLRHHKNHFVAHHGAEYLHADFPSFLRTVAAFLSGPGSDETILVRIQASKHNKTTSTRTFWETWVWYRDENPSTKDLFARFVYTGGGDWSYAVPTLGDTRGKLVVIQDFPHPLEHSEPAGLLWRNRNVLLISDNWSIVRSGEKLQDLTRFWMTYVPMLQCALAGGEGCWADLRGFELHGQPKLLVGFLSAASWMRTPGSVARHVWPRMWEWLEVAAKVGAWKAEPLGVVAGDFVTANTCRMLVRRNFREGGVGEGVDVEWDKEAWGGGYKQETATPIGQR